MKLIKPSVEILRIMVDSLTLIEEAGRTCYKSEDKIGEGTAKKFIEMIMKRGHESVLEHSSATVRFICDRGVSHEIVRHRLASYSQESTRYCDYEKGHVTFIIPPWVNIPEGLYDVPSDAGLEYGPDAVWLNGVWDTEETYKELRTLGWKPEQARSRLSNDLKTEIVMTCNFREWRHFFKLRTANTAHPQMREVAIPLLNQMKELVPIIFDDIIPGLFPTTEAG